STRTRRVSRRSTSSSAWTPSAASSRAPTSKPAAPVVAVAGATGFTGGLVIESLLRRGAAVRVIGRDDQRVQETVRRFQASSGIAAPGWTAGELLTAFRDCDAVVSCAGPFARAGRPVLRAALEAGLSYSDSTGEKDFIRLVFEEFDGEAKERGCCLVPAFGFDFVPGDLGAAIAAEGLGPLRGVDVVYAPRSLAISRGTRRTVAQGLTSGEL